MKFRFIFYSLFTLLLIGLGVLSNPAESAHFLKDWTIWYEPVVAGAVCGLLGGLLGLYMLWNRIVFVSLAITQGAGFGIFLSFFIAGFWGVSLEHSPLSLAAGLLVASSTAFLFYFFRRSKKHADEVLIGLIYVIASGLTVLIGDRIAEGKHAIDNLLFGNAVAVTSDSLYLLAAIAIGIFAVHFWFRRQFLYVSADADFLKAAGVKTGFWLVLLYLTLTVGITVSMKTLGSLPVFALMVIPPFISLRKAANPVEAVLLALFLGAVIPPMGYYFSFLYSFPTGASLIAVGSAYLAASSLERKCG
jgi:ABC-type Mn2+/Zn2+ transport system permease subunit